MSGWEEEVRAEFVSDMIHFGNAARTLVPFALADKSMRVKVAAIDALAWVSLVGMNQCLSELDYDADPGLTPGDPPDPPMQLDEEAKANLRDLLLRFAVIRQPK